MLTKSEKAHLQKSLSALGQLLITQAQDAHGFFITKTTHAVNYNDPVKRAEVQEKLDHSVALLGIANLMSIFESHFEKKYWSKVLVDSLVTRRLKAYKHIQLSAVNGFTGMRAEKYRSDFDWIMKSDNPLVGVKTYSKHNLLLTLQAVNTASTFIQDQYTKAIVRVHS